MMRTVFFLLSMIAVTNAAFSQVIRSGDYGSGLRLAFDAQTKKLTGYFEQYGGWNDKANSPAFSCVFYLEGMVNGSKVSITTYYPSSKHENIEGDLSVIGGDKLSIRLSAEHGGCWNVLPFKNEPVIFELEQKTEWVQVRYVTAGRTYFHSRPAAGKRQKAYLVKYDLVCIEKVEDDWAYASFFGKKTTSGWILLSDLN